MRNAEEILRAVLSKRNIVSDEDITEYLSERPQKTYDPFLMLDMEAGVDLLLSEADAGTKICIYGDYDADGVTSICILSSVLSCITKNFTYYIPSRFDEGYGLNKDAVYRISQAGAGLIVTVDCGSVSYEEVEYAKQLGMKVIVTDHHNIDDVKADCILINPHQKECTYPFSELAGCGVAFKMCQAIQKRRKLPKKVLNDVLDLAAIGTVGDIVSLTDENRTIVKYGLNRINSRSRRSLAALSSAIKVPWMTSEGIAFGIAPHINAAGRMSSAREAVKLLQAEDESTIQIQVEKLVELNSTRKQKQEEAYNECVDMISGDEDIIILHMDDIHEGIGGIAAGKIKENYYRPVIIVTPSGEGYIKGTGRSIPQIDIYKLLKRHEGFFERFGGHHSACGFLMKSDLYDEFKSALQEDVASMKLQQPDLLEKELMWDIEIRPEEMTVELAHTLDLMEPFGEGNPRPAFLMKNIQIDSVRFLGDGTHAGLFVSSAQGQPGGGADCILFRRAQEFSDVLRPGVRVDITGTVKLKEWRGRESVQFVIEEIISWRQNRKNRYYICS